MNKLIGIVACGGKSSRMKTDKSLLKYHILPQRYHVYNMLKKICDEVFLSVNKNQEQNILNGFNYIVDNEIYKDIGPMCALLSAKNKINNASFFIVGCDYPLIEINDLQKLISLRNIDYDAISYQNSSSKYVEPLLTIYEKNCLNKIEDNFNKKEYSLRHFLENNNTLKINAKNDSTIKSVDSIEEYELTLEIIKEK